MDKMISHYTTKRKTLRWPLAFFYNILDIACLASYIIHTKNNDKGNSVTHKRRIFLQDLAEQLALPAIQQRASNPQIWGHFGPRSGIECMLGKSLQETGESSYTEQNKRLPILGKCYDCAHSSTKRRRNTKKKCCICSKLICNVHSITQIKCHNCI